MTKPYQLTCYLCDETEQFDDIRRAKLSEWTEVSQTGVIKEDHYEHSAYCEGHSLDK